MRVDPVVSVAFFMLGLALVVTLSPIIAFLPRYLSAEKDLEEIELGYVFIYPSILVLDYYSEREERVPAAPVALLHIKRIRGDPELYMINGSLVFAHSVSADIGFLKYEGTSICEFQKKARLDESPLLRSLIIVKHKIENNWSYHVDSITVYSNLRRISFVGRRALGVSPNPYLGIARTYMVNVGPIDSNNSMAWVLLEYIKKFIPAELRDEVHSRASLVDYGYFYVSISTETLYPYLSMLIAKEFKEQCPRLHDLYKIIVEYAGKFVSSDADLPQNRFRDFTENIRLYSVNRIPRDQAWLEATWHNFNTLAPFPHALIILSVVLVLLRVRRR